MEQKDEGKDVGRTEPSEALRANLLCAENKSGGGAMSQSQG